MLKLRGKIFFISCSLIFLLVGCSDINNQGQDIDEQAITADLNTELSRVMECYQEALLSDDSAVVEKLNGILADFDSKYDSQLASEFQAFISEKATTRLTEPFTEFPPLYDLPINNDGDIYLSGGANSLAGYLIDWVAPNVTDAHYNHGAILDLDKFDPTDLDASCYQTALEKGAAYECPMKWMTKQNIAVMTPVSSLNSAALNSAQAAMDYYCDPNNTDMAYGFFKNTVNFFDIVSKSDNYYWYCTKVVWRVYNDLGIDIDSNSSLIDWSSSGLYSVVKTYYDTIYFWSRSKAKKALNKYIENTRNTIVLSEEIYFSPTMRLYYEVTR